MIFSPGTVLPPAFGLVMALYPAPWHFKTWNVATLSMIFWMTAVHLVQLVNAILWSDNARARYFVWADISCAIAVAGTFGLPIGHYLLAKHVESFTSLKKECENCEVTKKSKRRWNAVLLSIFGPVVGVLVHLTNMDRRFYIIEKLGPLPATYWDSWGLVWMAVVPLCFVGLAFFYTCKSVWNIARLGHLPTNFTSAHMSRGMFLRLLALSIGQFGSDIALCFVNVCLFIYGPQPLGSRGAPFHDLSGVETVMWFQIPTAGQSKLLLMGYMGLLASGMFFICYGTSTETTRFYTGIVRRVFNCAPGPRLTEKRASLAQQIRQSISRRTSRIPGLSRMGDHDGYERPLFNKGSMVEINYDEEELGSPGLDFAKHSQWQNSPAQQPLKATFDNQGTMHELFHAPEGTFDAGAMTPDELISPHKIVPERPASRQL